MDRHHAHYPSSQHSPTPALVTGETILNNTYAYSMPAPLHPAYRVGCANGGYEDSPRIEERGEVTEDSDREEQRREKKRGGRIQQAVPKHLNADSTIPVGLNSWRNTFYDKDDPRREIAEATDLLRSFFLDCYQIFMVKWFINLNLEAEDLYYRYDQGDIQAFALFVYHHVLLSSTNSKVNAFLRGKNFWKDDTGLVLKPEKASDYILPALNKYIVKSYRLDKTRQTSKETETLQEERQKIIDDLGKNLNSNALFTGSSWFSSSLKDTQSLRKAFSLIGDQCEQAWKNGRGDKRRWQKNMTKFLTLTNLMT